LIHLSEENTVKMRIVTLSIVAALALGVAGCETSEQNQRAGTGALIGGGVGALAGQAIGGNTGSTLVGAAGGALLGAAVGTATTPKRRGEELCRYQARDGRVYTAPCDERYYNNRY
jgi:outer membrane lipoprotein SlyB